MTSDDIDQALSAARQALRDAAPAPSQPPEPRTGVAADGLIQVTAESGRLTEVLIDPRAMRMLPTELADHLREAVNSALAREEVTEAAALPDPAALARQLEELQNQSVRQMARYTQSISEVMAALKQRG
ncbi:YbaB/EbfC family nucleoid-associated protein [Asanoa siamensis]|uniref:YbaB/EbfC DNA-binding family protein n=1 Tax=Asanoa siamensis TaxID=926357 RepID=A0ABQ4CLC1_9ACTN|nr:YbaB/EbfC family nucleoid-associated protein [Asanoa siamensis]GIF72076.1 hypothetical protein Asi02nite_15940 [Asanoa siamensis]